MKSSANKRAGASGAQRFRVSPVVAGCTLLMLASGASFAQQAPACTERPAACPRNADEGIQRGRQPCGVRKLQAGAIGKTQRQRQAQQGDVWVDAH